MDFTSHGKKDNSQRKFPGERGPRPDNNKHKRAEALERQTAWSKLSHKEQLTHLDRRLGKGVGASRQREKLEALLAAPEKK